MLSAILLALAASTSLVGGMSLEKRAGQTSAICAAQYQWMSNKAGDSPCLVAAKLGAFCNSGTWVIRPLIGPDGKVNGTYDNPTVAAHSANICTCSWSYYNLISACTTCQGAGFNVQFWPSYDAGCSGLESTTFFPSGFTFPQSLTVPFWAGQDPTKWNNQQFDVNAAQQLDNQGHDDLTVSPPTTQTKKKTNVGAIAGGVIGGLVVIGAAIAIATIIIRRNKAQHASKHQQMQSTGGSGTMTHGHMRSFSDATQKSDLSTGPHIYSTFTSTPMYGTSPTIQTHPISNGSGRSIPFLTSLMGGTASPPPPGGNISRQQTPPVNREDIVVPYREPPNSQQFSDRKHPGGPGIVYDHPDAPPPNASAMLQEIVRSSTPTRATRFNPPPYSRESSSPGTSTGPSAHRPAHTKKGSADTNHSMTSSVPMSPANTVTPLNSMAVYNPSSPPPPPENTSQEQSSGRNLSGPSRDTKRQSPQSDSFYGGDLA